MQEIHRGYVLAIALILPQVYHTHTQTHSISIMLKSSMRLFLLIFIPRLYLHLYPGSSCSTLQKSPVLEVLYKYI